MTLKIGIAGVRGLSMMLGFNSIPGVEVTALCDLHEGQLLERAAWLRIPNTYRIYEDMLESDIDAVFVATPMQFHLQQTIQALEAGKHVLCEVTAGVTMDELWWLKEAVEKHGKVYMMAENYCYIPENQLIGNMVRQGMFGDIYYAEGEYLHSNRHLA
ncbi:MAG: oxidoreductase domain protein, partial [Paenibacillus sp.]|nr:oxidoreductase domain protein [Paenibacillus sp.]